MKDQDVAVYAVWLPILGIDSKASMPMATKRFSDPRVHQYWDAKAALSRSFGPVLKTDEVVWDVYMLFDRNAEWKDIPPAPVYIMDKIGLEVARPLDGAELAKQLEALRSVPAKKTEFRSFDSSPWFWPRFHYSVINRSLSSSRADLDQQSDVGISWCKHL